ncbi:MAG: hypothetical protein RBR37_07815 [Advenella sp.]|jgi:hypothetical protein|nr:hypothetical protein [Advenella sp.]
MKKIIILPCLLLAACANGPVDDSKAAECAQVQSRIVQQPGIPGTSNFLSRANDNVRSDSERERARRMGCLD